jgi:arylsulfatase A-like enzyme
MGMYHRGRAPFNEIEPCKTPNLDKFAERCVIFENAYPEGLPTMPVRLQLMTGQYTLTCRGWEPMKRNDVPVQSILNEQGYICGMISDTYHFRAPGMNYHKDFHCYRWIRGQEYDPWVSTLPKRNIEDYVNENFSLVWRKRIEQFLANTDDFHGEEDLFPAKVFNEACQWLRKNRTHEKIFLWIDNFDPHEPWDPPKRFDTYTNSSYSGKRLIMPMGGLMNNWASEDEINFIRGLYAGEVSFVDHCIGRLFECLEEENYLEDSIILILADHGHPLGDHGKFLKGGDRMYSELLKVPFLVHLPHSENGGMRTDALVSFIDVLPTILHYMDQSHNTNAMHGESFLPVLKGDTNKHRSSVISGYFEAVDRCIRNKKWSYIMRPNGECDELYDLESDFRETSNLIDKQRDTAEMLSSFYGGYFRRENIYEVKGIQGQYEMGSGSML